MSKTISVTVWNEFRHEKKHAKVKEIYPDGMHATIARALEAAGGVRTRLAALDEPEHGLTEQVLADTDVLIWWGHGAHHEVADAIVDRVQDNALRGMGLICLHSSHYSKIFRRMMGTSCRLIWREAHERVLLWCTRPNHPITQGLPDPIILPADEMYGEHFDIPEPENLLWISSYPGGEVFRSGCTFTRGAGRIFYFAAGHETYPVYHDPNVQKVLVNAVRWCAPVSPRIAKLDAPKRDAGWFEKQ